MDRIRNAYLSPDEDKEMLTGIKGFIEGFGAAKDLLKLSTKVLNRFIPLIERKLQYHENGKEIITDDYYCYAKAGIKEVHSNLMIHEDPQSAFNCAIQCLGSPEFVIIWSAQLENLDVLVEPSAFVNGKYRTPTAIDGNKVFFNQWKPKTKKVVVVDEDAIIASISATDPEPVVDNIPSLEEVVKCINENEILNPEEKSFNMRDYYGNGNPESDSSNNPEVHSSDQAVGEAET